MMRVLLCAILGVGLTACGDENKDSSSLDFDGDPAAGAAHFRFCTSCHGDQGQGNQGGTPETNGPSLVSEVPDQSDDELYDIITNGYDEMAPVQGLTDEQIIDLIAYLRQEFPVK